MPPKRRKSPERSVPSKFPESYRPGVKERTSVGLPSFIPYSTRHVTFAPTLTSVRSSQETGDSRISLKTLLNAIKTMEGRLEGKIDILASRPFKNYESSHFLKRDSVSEDHKLNH